nr:hypothetical protein CFP56_12806 [Quercus suber]
MAKLRTAMDSAFWDLNVSSSRNLEGLARAIPSEPFPLDGARASRALHFWEMGSLWELFPLLDPLLIRSWALLLFRLSCSDQKLLTDD